MVITHQLTIERGRILIWGGQQADRGSIQSEERTDQLTDPARRLLGSVRWRRGRISFVAIMSRRVHVKAQHYARAHFRGEPCHQKLTNVSRITAYWIPQDKKIRSIVHAP